MILKNSLILFLPTLVCAANIEVAFSPKHGGQDLIIKTINSAHKSICMATYSFTSKPIANAILQAKSRGVAIKIVSDYGANGKHYTAAKYLANNGVDVRLNHNYAIMHNKFIIVDRQTVETGSYNYSAAAENKNAENVMVIWNNPEVANKYQAECEQLFNEAMVEHE